jgi:putative transposase
MKKKQYTEEQIVAVLQEHENGISANDVCRKYGIASSTFFGWRSKYGGMQVSDVKRLKQLEEENTKLKKLLGQSMLDTKALKLALEHVKKY